MRRPGPAAFLFVLHVAVALLHRFVGRMEFGPGDRWRAWDWFWQTLAMEDLSADLVGSIWNLHSQPPLLNLYGGLGGKLFGPDTGMLTAGYTLLGGFGVVLCHRLLLNLTGSSRLALIGGLVLALLPGFFVYEAYLLYTLPAAVLVLLAVERLAAFRATDELSALIGFVATLNGLILLRSAFHLVLLAVAIPLGAVLADKRWRRFVLLALLVSLPSVLWYAKNQVKFGFFGASSWAGQGVFRAASRGSSAAEREGLGPVVGALPAFSRPSRYAPFGFDEESDVPVLARDDFNNVNVPAISAVYGEAAATMVTTHPVRYAKTVVRSYALFCGPSTRYKHVTPLAEGMGFHESAYTSVLTLGGLAERQGSVYAALIPVMLLLHLGVVGSLCRRNGAKWLAYMRADPAMVFGWTLVVYTVLVGCLFEYGENDRFKFMVEPLLLVLSLALCHRSITKGWDRVVPGSGERP